jgi:excisionase family DNA binding protein
MGDFCRLYGIGRTKAYAEIAAHRLRAVKVGRRTLITHEAAEAWLTSLPELKKPNPINIEEKKTQRSA